MHVATTCVHNCTYVPESKVPHYLLCINWYNYTLYGGWMKGEDEDLSIKS